jgi:hypothetical protein
MENLPERAIYLRIRFYLNLFLVIDRIQVMVILTSDQRGD